jgi:hypothetical protein
MHKQCLIHPKSWHTLFECVTIRKSLKATPLLKQESERKRRMTKKGVTSWGLKTSWIQKRHQHHLRWRPRIPFQAQKLTLREILSVEPAMTRPLRYNEVPISFSRDVQWTSFSEPGKFPLVLDPVMVGSQLTRVLIDGGSGLNLLFTSTLKKMGLDISKMLTPSKTPFYGIIPGNAATPLRSVVLPVTFGTKDNYRTEYIKFEVADFNSSYHAILGRPALAKFMAVPHCVYLLLKMPGKIGILTLCGDLKKSYNCDQEAIEYSMTSRVPEPSAEALAAALKLTNTEMEISNQRPSKSRVKPNLRCRHQDYSNERRQPVQDHFDWGQHRRQIGKRAHQLS